MIKGLRNWFSLNLTAQKQQPGLVEIRQPDVLPMPENAFWFIIERARYNTKDVTYTMLWRQLQDCEEDQIQAFASRYLAKKKQMASPRAWVVATMLNGEMTCERFDAFLNWVISIGKSNYEILLLDPDELAPHISEDMYGHALFEDHGTVPAGVWNEKHSRIASTKPTSGFPAINDVDNIMAFPVPDSSTFKEIVESLPNLCGWSNKASVAATEEKGMVHSERPYILN